MKINKAIIFSSFIFLTGISSGVFLAILMNPADKLEMANFLSNYLFSGMDSAIVYPNPFISSSLGNLFLLLLIFLSGLSAVGFPAAYIVLFYKGTALGFTAGIIIDQFSLHGVGSLCLTMLPQNIIIIPVFIIAVTLAYRYGSQAIAGMRGSKPVVKSTLRKDGRNYIMHNIILAGAIMLGCIIEFLFALIAA